MDRQIFKSKLDAIGATGVVVMIIFFDGSRHLTKWADITVSDLHIAYIEKRLPGYIRRTMYDEIEDIVLHRPKV